MYNKNAVHFRSAELGRYRNNFLWKPGHKNTLFQCAVFSSRQKHLNQGETTMETFSLFLQDGSLKLWKLILLYILKLQRDTAIINNGTEVKAYIFI